MEDDKIRETTKQNKQAEVKIGSPTNRLFFMGIEPTMLGD
jgi:hypothetical protein